MSLLLIYFIPLIVIIYIYMRRRQLSDLRHAQVLEESMQAGLTEPPSLHPVIDARHCIGSGACVSACPESALGIIGGKAILTNPSACIGHGACYAACPVDAITLVFGTERRGVDIPDVSPNFESNVPGVFIAGELGGMGLIRKAAEQGRQAVETIARMKKMEADYDVVIVGSGPAGMAAGLCAIENHLKYVLLEQEESLGGSIFHYPRNKVAMTAPVTLPVVGKMLFKEVSKEKLLEFWQDVVTRTRLKIHTGERMESLVKEDGIFVVKTNRTQYRATNVLLAIGRRGSPRKLEVPGEELSKVTYRVTDPEQFRGQNLLVVGGGDSAVEAAIACAEHESNVTLSYRGTAFTRLKSKNRERLEALGQSSKIEVLLGSEVTNIGLKQVDIRQGEDLRTIDNDAVVISIGGVLPTDLLMSVGIRFEKKFGER